MKISLSARWMLLALLATPRVTAQDPAEAVREGDFIVYTVQAGDTLKELAERFMGGSQFIPELLQFNQIANPTTVGEGYLLAIPRAVRNHAIIALSRAEAALAEALTAEAPVYAEQEFQFAKETLTSARQARNAAEYDRAVAISELARLRAKRALQLADQNAPVQQPATVAFAQGTVERSTDGGATWNPAPKGTPLPVKDILRTGSASRAEVALADGSIIQVTEASQFAVDEFRYDRRNGKRNSRLRVILGGILGNIRPKDQEDSAFEIDAGSAAVAIRGTQLRVGADEAQTTRVAVLDGHTSVSAAGRETDVPADYGTVARKDRPPAPPIQLLPPPRPAFPTDEDFRTAVQTILFEWEPLPQRRLAQYHFELAKDEAFNAIVLERFLRNTRHRSDVLAEGNYFWRVSSVDGNGLEGPPTPAGSLTIAKNLRLELVTGAPPFTSGEKLYVGPDNFLHAKPASSDTSVVRLECAVDDEPYRELTEPIRLERDGVHTLRFRGVGADDLPGEEAALTVVLDTTPPDVSVEIGPMEDDPREGRVVRVTLRATDNTAVDSIEYSVNEGAFQVYNEPLVFSAYQSGDIAFRAVDEVGNVSPLERIHLLGEWVPLGPSKSP